MLVDEAWYAVRAPRMAFSQTALLSTRGPGPRSVRNSVVPMATQQQKVHDDTLLEMPLYSNTCGGGTLLMRHALGKRAEH